MGWRQCLSIILLTVANITLPLSILLFASGFFPYKPFLPGFGQHQADSEIPPPHFDKIIFMVVDALRSDFVFSTQSEFVFVQKLIRDGDALPFTAHAAPPTITMPKVKAITTGSVPSFVDVILNFAESDTSSTLKDQDTWLSQLLRRSNKERLVFYGDDTWLKLFPGTFDRSDGTSSFFVSDFTEVDNNVTRHIPLELANEDWSGMIMHFLGMDHIGHKSGPQSPHMGPKQIEMDYVVRTLFEAVQSRPHLSSTLIILCGDHGMNEAGNHGGSASSETSPALVFISPKFRSISSGLQSPEQDLGTDFRYYDQVEQADIAPTVAGLLGLPIPINNIGVFIPKLLALWPDARLQFALLRQNANQVLRILKVLYNNIDFDSIPSPEVCANPEANEILVWCLWSEFRYQTREGRPEVIQNQKALLEFLYAARNVMSKAASNYDVPRLWTGIILASVSSLTAIISTIFETSFSASSTIWFVLMTVGSSLTMFSSSFVEEEQQFWFWMGSAWLAWLCGSSILRRSPRQAETAWTSIVLLVCFRVLRRWNQTGQKHSGDSDIGRTYFTEHNLILWVLIPVTLFYSLPVSPYHRNISLAWFAIQLSYLVVCILETLFKLAFSGADSPELVNSIPRTLLLSPSSYSLLLQARLIFFFLIILLLHTIICSHSSQRYFRKKGFRTFHGLVTLFLIMQSRPNNIPIFLIFVIMHVCLRRLKLQPSEVVITSIIMQFTSFFSMGGSNAISSVDLSNAYNGISGYNVAAVGLLTFIGNWAGPIWWAFDTQLIIWDCTSGRKHMICLRLGLLTIWNSMAMTSVMAACAMLRAHLFVWTVFSPKFLFAIAWVMGQHLGVNILATFVGILTFGQANLRTVP